MTTHQLARALLTLPDIQVTIDLMGRTYAEELDNATQGPLQVATFGDEIILGPLLSRRWREDAVQNVSEISVSAFQDRVRAWIVVCFGHEIADNVQERCHRFLEESLELVQSLGCTESETKQLVDYVYGRPKGEPVQETGGVMVTLAALCSAMGIDLTKASEMEVARVWTKVEQIRAKQAAKPKHSPLPQ